VARHVSAPRKRRGLGFPHAKEKPRGLGFPRAKEKPRGLGLPRCHPEAFAGTCCSRAAQGHAAARRHSDVYGADRELDSRSRQRYCSRRRPHVKRIDGTTARACMPRYEHGRCVTRARPDGRGPTVSGANDRARLSRLASGDALPFRGGPPVARADTRATTVRDWPRSERRGDGAAARRARSDRSGSSLEALAEDLPRS
jgi:hypothetical protein